MIDNQVDQTTGTVKLKAEFPNANLQLWPGQFVNVRVLIDTLRQVVVVPTAAVQRGPNGTFVYVVKDDNTVDCAARDAHAAGRRAGRDRDRPAGGRARRHHRLCPPDRGHPGGGVERRGRRAGHAPTGRRDRTDPAASAAATRESAIRSGGPPGATP